jgi:hypothetical protein
MSNSPIKIGFRDLGGGEVELIDTVSERVLDGVVAWDVDVQQDVQDVVCADGLCRVSGKQSITVRVTFSLSPDGVHIVSGSDGEHAVPAITGSQAVDWLQRRERNIDV